MNSKDQSETLLRMIEPVLAESQNLDTMLERALDVLIEATRAERGFIILIELDGRFTFRATRNIDREAVQSPQGKISTTVCQEAIRTQLPLLTAEAMQDERLMGSDSLERIKTLSILCVPVCLGARVLGVIYLDNRFLSCLFVRSHLDLVVAFAKQLAAPLQNSKRVSELNEQLAQKQRELEQRFHYDQIIGKSSKMQEVYRLLDRVIPTDLPVLIQGESGTGKELVARAIHFNGPRKTRPFIAENCAAVTASLLESELFGHVRGAFTGADRDKTGLFEQAHGGTLFLDEISSMGTEMQGSLLRALQSGEIRSVGSSESRRVDVRVIAASNQDLAKLVKAGKFREDLYYRLKVVLIQLPPLRERLEDIPSLTHHILQRLSKEQGKPLRGLSEEVVNQLMQHPWPGNVRELENEIRRAAALTSDEIRTEHLNPEVRSSSRRSTSVYGAATLKEVERNAIVAALERVGWNKKEAAHLLGIPRTTLYSRMKFLGIPDPGE